MKKLVLFFLATALLCNIVGCNQSANKGSTAKYSSKKGEQVTYPIESDEELTYWCSFTPTNTASNLGETPFGKQLLKETGIKVKFIHPTEGNATEQLNLMLASGDLPDIIENSWLSFGNGPEDSINSGYIIDINQVINNYAPNYKKYLEENKDIDRMTKTDTGKRYVFPFIRSTDLLTVFQGPIIRKDWLDELGLEQPTTIDEIYAVLTAFKNKKGAQSPLSFNFANATSTGFLVGAFGISDGFYQEDSVVKFGPIQPGYKQYIETMRKWYAEGLLDKNIANIDNKTLDSNILNDKTGMTFGFAGGSIGTWIKAKKDSDKQFTLKALMYPTLQKGEFPKFGQKDSKYVSYAAAAISSKCKNVELAARLLDYGYSEKGSLLFNFGTEGQSYTMEQGEPKYTDLILKNPNGLSIAQSLANEIRSGAGPYVQDERYLMQYYQLPEQKEAIETWVKTDALKHNLPPLTVLPEESSKMSKIMADINTYKSEKILKFIMGAEDISNFNEFVNNIKQMGIDEIIKIQQGALERYENK